MGKGHRYALPVGYYRLSWASRIGVSRIKMNRNGFNLRLSLIARLACNFNHCDPIDNGINPAIAVSDMNRDRTSLALLNNHQRRLVWELPTKRLPR